MSTRAGGWLTLALVAGLLAGCDTTTGPKESGFDANTALADYRAMDGILASEGFRGFLALGGAVSISSFDPGVDVGLSARALRAVRGPADARAFALSLVGAAAPLDAASAPVISTQHRGRTFTYRAESSRYEVDPSRTGAPATGVRFIVYAETGSGQPDPAREIGYADLIDEGDGSAEDIALRLVVVVKARTLLDYRTTLDENGGQGRITVDGFVRDDNDQLDFSIQAGGAAGKLDVAFRMAIENRAFEIQGAVTGAEQGDSGTGDVDVTVRHGAESFRVDLSGTPTTIGGTVYLNGKSFVEVTGHPRAPVFKRPGGGAISGVEALVLHRIMDVVEDVFDLFENLLDPIDELVILAIIL